MEDQISPDKKKDFGFKYKPEEQREIILKIIRNKKRGLHCMEIVRWIRKEYNVAIKTVWLRLNEMERENKLKYHEIAGIKWYYSVKDTKINEDLIPFGT